MLVRRPARHVLFMLLVAALTLASCNIGAAPAPTIDANAISTAAYSTAVAQISAGQTQTALAAPFPTLAVTNTAISFPTFSSDGSAPGANTALPTFSFNNNPNTNTTPAAGATPLGSPAAPVVPAAPAGATQSLGDACNNLQYLSDVTIPDNSEVKPGINFQKVWAVKNTGSCTWDEGFALVFIGGDRAMDPVDYVFSNKSDKDFVSAGETINLGINLTAPCTPGTYQGTWRMKNDKGYYFGSYLSIIFVVKTKCK